MSCDRIKLTVSVCLLAAAAALAGTPTASERETHTFECIAALDAKADDLARQVRAGQAQLQPLLLTTLEAGAAFIGNAYLQGERDEARSQALLATALQAQKALSDAALVARQAPCAQEGTQLLSEADLIGRFVVSRLVQRRLHKLLEN